jgi:hypothetical protein
MSATAMLELQQDRPNDMKSSAYSLAFNKTSSFESACEQRSKLLQQCKASLRCMGEADEKIDDENAIDFLLCWAVVPWEAHTLSLLFYTPRAR